MRRLLDLDVSGSVTGTHVRIIAEAAGVSERTMWRWLAEARGGRLEARPRANGFALSDALWAELGRLDGNVSALHRALQERHAARVPAGACAPENGDDPSALENGDGASVPEDGNDASAVPSLPTLQRVVRRDIARGRALHVAPRQSPALPGPGRYDRALADLRLDEVFDDLAAASPAPGTPGPGTPPAPPGPRARLYTPDARLVATGQVAAVVEVVGHAAAAQGVLCVYGDPGRGKTVAVERALALLPPRTPVWRAVAPVQATLPQLRHALTAVLDEAPSAAPRQASSRDRALADALTRPGVFFLDDAQRLAPALLDYLRLLWDAPGTTAALIVCGAGAERAIAQAPALASRVLSWHEVPRLDPGRLPDTLRLFHHLWHTAADEDIRHVDDTVAHGNFRAWAKITSHLHATVTRLPDTAVDRALLTQACTRLGPPA